MRVRCADTGICCSFSCSDTVLVSHVSQALGLQLTKRREDRPGKASGLCADLPERRLEESFLVPPSKGEEDGFRWNSDPQSQTKAQARQALANNNRERCVVYASNRSGVFLFYSRKDCQSSNVCISRPSALEARESQSYTLSPPSIYFFNLKDDDEES